MKFNSLLILFCILPSLLCLKGGVMGAINETMAYAALHHFYENISNYIQNITLDPFDADSVTISNGHINISNFEEDKVYFKFNSDSINIKVNNINGVFSGRASKKIVFWKEARNFDIYIDSANLEVDLAIKTKNDSGKLVPDGEIVNTKAEANINVDIHGTFGDWFEGAVEKEIRKHLDEAFNKEAKNFLQIGLEKIPLDIIIDSSKGYHLDLSLASDIEMKDGFFTINSYALFYNENKTETQNKNRFSLTEFPSIERIGNQFEILVSEYSINSGLFTLQKSNDLNYNVVVPITTEVLDLILPGILEFYGKKNVEFGIYLGIPTTKITEDYLNVEAAALIVIKAEGDSRPFVALIANVSASVELEINNGIVKGTIVDFDIKIVGIYINKSTNKDISEALVSLINSKKLSIIPKLNKYIPIVFTIPPISGISFKELSLKTKDKYLLVNYNLSY